MLKRSSLTQALHTRASCVISRLSQWTPIDTESWQESIVQLKKLQRDSVDGKIEFIWKKVSLLLSQVTYTYPSTFFEKYKILQETKSWWLAVRIWDSNNWWVLLKNSLALYELESVWVWKNWDLTPKRRINNLFSWRRLPSIFSPSTMVRGFFERMKETSFFCSYLLPLAFDSILNVFSTALDLGQFFILGISVLCEHSLGWDFAFLWWKRGKLSLLSSVQLHRSAITQQLLHCQ